MGRSRWRRGALAALVLALVLAAFVPWPVRHATTRSDAGVAVAQASEGSHLRLAQRIKRGPAEEETPAKPETPAAPAKPEPEKSPLATQNQADADKKSAGCMTCHTKPDSQSMHTATTVKLGCVDCHGGRVEVRAPDVRVEVDELGR